jgi:hypothetical protein
LRQRRELLRSEISRISVARAKRTGNKFDPSRVTIDWKTVETGAAVADG